MKSYFKKNIICIIIIFSLYLTATLFQSQFFGDLIGVIGDTFACLIIFVTISKLKPSRERIIFLLFGFALIVWLASDILWAFYDLIFQIDPKNDLLTSLLYLISSIFIIIATITYLIYNSKSWDTFQLILDSIAMSINVLWLIWIIVFDKNTNELGLILNNTIINTINITLDVILLLGTMIWFLSIRGGKIPKHLHIIIGSVFFYTITDLGYFYIYMKNMYTDNSLIDVCYLASFLGITVGILVYKNNNKTDNEKIDYSNKGYRRKWWVLLPSPLLVVFFKGYEMTDIVFFCVIIIIHEGLSHYIQISIQNNQLLVRERNLNKELDKLVSERTLELQKKNKELEYNSTHDELTGIFNRRYFFKAVNYTIKEIKPDEKLALIVWSLDKFKTINDTYGHKIGDQVIIKLIDRIKNVKNDLDIVARLGDAEFGFLLRENKNKNDVDLIVDKITKLISEPIKVDPYTFKLTCSIGVSVYPVDSDTCDNLIKCSNIALSYSKKQRIGLKCAYYKDINNIVLRKKLIEAYLEKADYDKEFSLNYQPQFRMSDKELIGMEALLRWNCPELGFISPAEFIPIAEEAELIVSIGHWVMETAIKQISIWNNNYHKNIKMGINISSKQLDQENICSNFYSLIQKYHALPEWIDLEITESITLDNENKISLLENCFQAKGISISIDDYGTGYSTISYLQMINFDRLKIAKPLIDNITISKTDEKIISSIISLAKDIDILTIAEGVETQEQFDMLLNLGCDQIQGYLLGKPITSFEFEKNFLENKNYIEKNLEIIPLLP